MSQTTGLIRGLNEFELTIAPLAIAANVTAAKQLVRAANPAERGILRACRFIEDHGNMPTGHWDGRPGFLTGP